MRCTDAARDVDVVLRGVKTDVRVVSVFSVVVARWAGAVFDF